MYPDLRQVRVRKISFCIIFEAAIANFGGECLAVRVNTISSKAWTVASLNSSFSDDARKVVVALVGLGGSRWLHSNHGVPSPPFAAFVGFTSIHPQCRPSFVFASRFLCYCRLSFSEIVFCRRCDFADARNNKMYSCRGSRLRMRSST